MPYPCFTSARVIADNALASLPHLLRAQGLEPHLHPLFLVSDPATHAAAGKAVLQCLQAEGWRVQHHDLGDAPSASVAQAESLLHALHVGTPLPAFVLAVGSGTLNDLTKHAAHRFGVPYGVVATAASMNGYSSANASLLAHGHKTSFPASPARFVLADLGVLAAAPPRLTKAGLGDMLCRSTVEADCLLSHYLWGTAYPKAAFDRLREQEALLLRMLEADAPLPDCMLPLMTALCEGGDAMTATGSSAVASQGEHMLVHLLELMIGEDAAAEALHGEWVAMTTLWMHAMQHATLARIENMLQVAAQQTPLFNPLPFPSTGLFAALGGEMTAHCEALYAQKMHLFPAPHAWAARLKEVWPALQAALRAVMLPASALPEIFARLGLRCTPEDFPIHPTQWAQAQAYGYGTRDRFTFLDLYAALR